MCTIDQLLTLKRFTYQKQSLPPQANRMNTGELAILGGQSYLRWIRLKGPGATARDSRHGPLRLDRSTALSGANATRSGPGRPLGRRLRRTTSLRGRDRRTAGEMGLGAAKVWPNVAGPEDGVCFLADVRRIAGSG